MDIIDELFGPETDMDRLAETNHLEQREWIQGLVAMRGRRQLSQAQVGELMGVAQSTVARIEGGDRDMRLSSLFRYALAVNAKVSHIVTPAEDDALVATYRLGSEALLPVREKDMTSGWAIHERVQATGIEVLS